MQLWSLCVEYLKVGFEALLLSPTKALVSYSQKKCATLFDMKRTSRLIHLTSTWKNYKKRLNIT